MRRTLAAAAPPSVICLYRGAAVARPGVCLRSCPTRRRISQPCSAFIGRSGATAPSSPGRRRPVAGELSIVAGKTDLSAQLPLEHVLLPGIPFQRLRPVVERRGVVDAETHRDQVVVLVECGVRRGDAVSGQGAGLVVPHTVGAVLSAHADRCGAALGKGTGGELRVRQPEGMAVLAGDSGCSKQCQCEAEAGACRRSPPTGLVARAGGRASDQDAARATTKSNACSESNKAGLPCSFTRSGHSSLSGAPEVIIEA